METLAEQGSQRPLRPEEGRRPSEHDIDELVSAYLEGSSIEALATRLVVSRTTFIGHLDLRGIERRTSVRKMTNRSVRQAANRFASGESLSVVTTWFGRREEDRPRPVYG